MGRPDSFFLGRSWLLAVFCGLGLRLFQIGDQILADDEWHAVHALLYRNYSYLFSHFGGADYCIPLTVLYKWLGNHLGLSEMTMRAPMLVFGVGTVFVLPLLVRGEIGAPASRVFAWLLAISPIHIYYSRYARPYSITMFMAFLGIIAFFKWWSNGKRRWAVIYVLCAVLGPYFHLAVLPILAAPLLVAVGLTLVARNRVPAPSLRDFGWICGAVAAGLTSLLIVPLITDFQTLAEKAEVEVATSDTVWGVVQLFIGTRQTWLIWIAILAVLAGSRILARPRPRFLAYIAFVALLQITLVMLARFSGMQYPIVLARYCLSILPIGLLLLAAGLAGVDRSLRRSLALYPRGGVAVAACALLLYFGPLRGIYYRPNNWTNHALFQYQYGPGPYDVLRPQRIPRFYFDLGSQSRGSVLILEAPWYFGWYNNNYPYYQQIHRQKMKIGLIDRPGTPARADELPLHDRRLAFRNFIHVSDHMALQRDRVQYVVFHRNLDRELPGRPSVDVTPWLSEYEQLYGTPSYADQDITVFDVARRRPLMLQR